MTDYYTYNNSSSLSSSSSSSLYPSNSSTNTANCSNSNILIENKNYDTTISSFNDNNNHFKCLIDKNDLSSSSSSTLSSQLMYKYPAETSYNYPNCNYIDPVVSFNQVPSSDNTRYQASLFYPCDSNQISYAKNSASTYESTSSGNYKLDSSYSSDESVDQKSNKTSAADMDSSIIDSNAKIYPWMKKIHGNSHFGENFF